MVKKGYDIVLISFILIVFGFGSLMVFSATCFMSSIEYDTNPFAYIQLRNIVAGLTAFLAGILIPYKFFKRRSVIYTIALLLLSVLLGMVLYNGFAREAKGAARWVFGIQPSEFGKVILIFLFAFLLDKNSSKLENFKVGIIFNFMVLGVFATLILLQPSYSIAALTSFIIIVMMYVSGVKVKHLTYAMLVLIPIAIAAFLMKGYRADRALTFFQDKSKSSYQENYFQQYQSIVTIGNGGLLGVGLGESLAKEKYLPEAHNDFIFAVICDEIGFVGTLFFILVYGYMIYRIFKVATISEDKFGFLIVVGVGTKITIFAIVNMLIAVGAFPTTGITLPLISYGGSNLAVTMVSLGVVVNICRSSHMERLNGAN